MVNETPTHLSLFSGIGGLDLASNWAGFKTIAFCEIDEYCQKVLRKHWPEVPIIDDVTNLRTNEFLAEYGLPFIISAGFPCQPHSNNGKRLGELDDRNLWPDVIRVVAGLRPTWFVGENVPGLLTTIHHTCIQDLETEDYETWTYLLPACAFGADHKRERVFIIAHDKSQRMEKLRPERFIVSHSLAQKILPVRSSDGQWKIEPDLRRVPDGIPDWVDRLKCLGNAVVPYQAYPFFQLIYDIEMEIRGKENS